MKYADFTYSYIKIFVKFCIYSLYSPEFYQDVYQRFTGWGIRYIFTASFIATLIIVVPFFNLLVEVKDYFASEKITKNLEGLDHIINQFPTLKFDGKNISIEEEEPYLIFNSQDQKYAVIDTRNIPNVKYKDVKIVLNKDKMIINLKLPDKSSSTILPIEYDKIINETGTFNIVDIKKILSRICDSTIKAFTYFLMPIIILFNFVFVILQKLINIAIIYVFLNMFIRKSMIKDAFRLVMLASAPSIIISQIAFFLPILKNVAPLIEIWSLVLMVYSLNRLKTIE